MRFARAVLHRPYMFTVAFLVANFFVFLLMWQSSGMSWSALLAFPEPVLLAYGAKRNDLIILGHQWWRFVAPMFIHVNLPHVLINMYSLWMVGPYVEKLYGSAKFVFFWVMTGVAGVVASYLTVAKPGTTVGPIARFIFKTHDIPSAGASGALFGLVGVLFVFGIKFRHELPEGFKRAFGTGLLPVIVINLFIGFVGRGFIDNAAHLGGLVSGAALALVVGYRRPGERPSIAISWHVLQVMALALVAVSFFKVAQHFRDPVPAFATVENGQVALPDKGPDSLRFKKAMNDAQEALNDAVRGEANGVDTAVAALEAAPAPDIKGDQLRRKLESLLKRAKELAKSGVPGTGPESKPSQQMRNQLQSDFDSWKQEYEEWLRTAARE
jgi:rhomboid protease GluP